MNTRRVTERKTDDYAKKKVVKQWRERNTEKNIERNKNGK